MNQLVVYVGRFQPFHNGHYSQIFSALEKEQNKLLILMGETTFDDNHGLRTTTNPFGSWEREQMIIDSLPLSYIPRIRISSIYDQETDERWFYNLHCEVSDYQNSMNCGSMVRFQGNMQDPSCSWMNKIHEIDPLWTVRSVPDTVGFHGVDIRKDFFGSDGANISFMVPPSVYTYLFNWKHDNEDEYERLASLYRTELTAKTI